MRVDAEGDPLAESRARARVCTISLRFPGRSAPLGSQIPLVVLGVVVTPLAHNARWKKVLGLSAERYPISCTSQPSFYKH